MKNIKLCVVGGGNWGKNHIRTLYEFGCLGGIVDTSHMILEDLKTLYEDCIFLSNLEESFEENFDGYIVATPPKTHFELAKKIIERKKPLLVEKPLTLNLKDSIKLNDLAKNNNVNLMVGHLLLFHPAFLKIKKIIREDRLGEIQYIYSNRLNLGSFRKDENVLWSFAPHDISLFNYFFEDLPLRVDSSGIDILQEGIHDTSITTFKYRGKKMGHIFVSWLHPFKEHRFVIVGSKGMIHFEDVGKRKPLMYYDKPVDLNGDIPKSRLSESYEINYEEGMPLKSQLEYFISKIKNGSLNIANGDSAVDVMRVLDLATKSLVEKKL